MSTSLRTTFAATAFASLLCAGFVSPSQAEEPFCYECHDALPEASVAHDPVAEGDCTACHEDHGDAEELRLVEEGNALCYQCHDELEGASNIHPPVEDGCTSCHNPHGSGNSYFLAAPAEEVCFECHDQDAFAHENVHAAVDDGCTVCHSPHSSNHSSLLAAPAEEVCFECHDQDAFTQENVHAAVDDGCSTCHSPHSSDNSSLLNAAMEEVCFGCHDDTGFRDKVLHAAVDEGCADCHDPHSSPNEKLFTANLTLDRLQLFEEEQAELCFNCHDAGAFTAKQTEDTGFRHGTNNLHSLHLSGGAKPNKYGFIKPKDGQTCVACHLPHSAHQAMLIRTEFECKGIFCYTMRFTPNDFGGTCVVGCHKPKTYSRTAAQEGSAVTIPPAGKSKQGTP